MTYKQVAAAKAKNWILYYYNGNAWGEYNPDLPIDEEYFPDANFRSWLLEQTYGSDGKLTDAEIAVVTSINVSNKSIADLTGIENFTALENLNCSINQLTTLDVSGCTALDGLYCDNNQLTSLDVSKNTALEMLSCSNNQLTTLDVSGLTALDGLACFNNQLTALDVSDCTALEELYCHDNKISIDGMEVLLGSLPVREAGLLSAVDSSTDDDDNVMTTAQVAAAREKGWIVYDWNGYSPVAYDGITLEPEPYAVLSNGGKTLTFYYDQEKSTRGGLSIDRGWSDDSRSITAVEFDESFAACTTLTSMTGWFENCSALRYISGLDYLNTSNVTDMSYMFSGCSSLKSISVGSFDTGKVTDMNSMFEGCQSLTTITVSDAGWSTGSLSTGNAMFQGCRNLMGGNGTAYNAANTGAEYARIDRAGSAGYLTSSTPTGVKGISAADSSSEGYYTTDGRRMKGQPARKGIYISNGRKVLVK